MKKVLFIISSLGGGGAEKVILNILLHIDRDKIKPELLLYEREGEYLADLPSDVPIKALKKKERDDGKIKWRIFGITWFILINRMTKFLKSEKPDVIVSFMWYTNFVTLLSKRLSRIRCRVIVSERYGLSASHEGWIIEFLRRLVIRFFYPKAHIIVVNAKEMDIQLRNMFNIPQEKIAVIYNPVDLKKINQMGMEDTNHYWYAEKIPVITAIGRLTLQKGFICLLKSVHILISENIPCRLIILGEGPEKKRLKKLALELGIDNKVSFLGFQQNPYKYLKRSTIFVLSSIYEGFPNVLLESMALGIPSIATRCPTGPEEIITDGVNGILVPPSDERALADAIKKLLLDKDLRKRLSEAARKRAEDFRVEKIIKQYEDVIENLCAGSAEN